MKIMRREKHSSHLKTAVDKAYHMPGALLIFPMIIIRVWPKLRGAKTRVFFEENQFDEKKTTTL